MPLRFVLRAQLFTNKSQIVVGVGIAGIQPDGVAEVQPCRFQPADFFQNAPQIEMGQSVFGICPQSASKVFGRFF
jgi:hypothetical protein